MNCCGSDRKTNFCPNCGKKLIKCDPLVELLVHVARTATAYQEQFARFADKPPTEGCVPRYEKVYKQKKKMMEKWQGWQAAIEEVLLEKGGGALEGKP